MTDRPDLRSTEIEVVYGRLVTSHGEAMHERNIGLAGRINEAIGVFEELWPVETGRWRAKFSPGKPWPRS